MNQQAVAAGLAAERGGLLRVMGRWDLTAQGVNLILAASVFVLPGITLGQLGGWSPLAVLAAAVGVMFILLSFAEAAGRYREAGGPYRYAGDAFGEYVGAQIGILFWVVRATAAASVADVFVTYAAELWPRAAQPGWRAFLLSVSILGSGWLNVRGTRLTASVLNFLTLVKVLPLLVLCGVGFFSVSWDRFMATPPPESSAWARAILLWVFAFGGAEATLVPASEARNPTRDMPRALLRAFAIVVVVYMAAQILVAGILPSQSSPRPVGDVARILFSGAGSMAVAVVALFATNGHIAGAALAASRITFAIADRGSLPPVLARVHPRFKTPAASIALFTLLVWLLAISGSFIWNASISAVGRLIVFEATFLGALWLRRVGPSAFPVPIWVHSVAIAFCAWLLLHQTLQEALVVGTVLVTGSAIWLGYGFARRRSPESPRPVAVL